MNTRSPYPDIEVPEISLPRFVLDRADEQETAVPLMGPADHGSASPLTGPAATGTITNPNRLTSGVQISGNRPLPEIWGPAAIERRLSESRSRMSCAEIGAKTRVRHRTITNQDQDQGQDQDQDQGTDHEQNPDQ